MVGGGLLEIYNFLVHEALAVGNRLDQKWRRVFVSTLT